MTPKEFVIQYRDLGSIKAVSRNHGMTWYQTRKVYQEAVSQGLMDAQPVGRKTNAQAKAPEPIFVGETRITEARKFEVPKRGIKRYIFTSAQNNTTVNKPLWDNIMALAKHYRAEVHVSRFTYMKSGIGRKGDKADFTDAKKETLYGGDTLAWAPELTPYLSDHRCEVAPGLVWCGEWQRLPTTKRPLSGYETYTGRKSGIFPHAKFEMASVPAGKFEDTKFNYTTGTVTMRNYIVKGAGLQATFHHGYGALLVEVDADGDWFGRQLNASSNGTICDLDVMAKNGKVTIGHTVTAINWGDIHDQRLDKVCAELSEDMLMTLQPEYQFIHDLLNFGSRNHHDIKDPFKRFALYCRDEENVNQEVVNAMGFVWRRATRVEGTQTIVVDSNHDRAMERWLREADWKHDPVNMLFFMEAAHAKLTAIANDDPHFHMIRHWWDAVDPALMADLPDKPDVRFLDEDEGFVICEDAHGGIECGMHGHLGANGARGSAAGFAKMGRKANVGHTHQAGIYDGIYTAGTSSQFDLGYNRGPGSWSHSHIVTYENGKRAIYTMYNGKWKAGRSKLRQLVIDTKKKRAA